MDFPSQPSSTSGIRALPAVPNAASTVFRLSSPTRPSPAKSHSPCSSGASSAVTNVTPVSRHNSPDSVLRARDFDLLVHSVGPQSPSATADILDLYSETGPSIMDGPRNSQGRNGRAEIEDLLTGRGPGTPRGLEACVGGGSGGHHQPRYVDTDPGLWWPDVPNVCSSRASPASYFSSFQAGGGGAGCGYGGSNCGGDGTLNSPSAPFSTGIMTTGPRLREGSAGSDVATSADTGKSDPSSQKQAQSGSKNNNSIGEPSTSGDSRPGLNLQQSLAPAGKSRTDNSGLATTSSVVPSSFGLQRLSNLSHNHYYWPSSRPNISSPTSSPVQYSHNSSRNLPHSPFSVAAPSSGLPGSAVFRPVIEPGRQSSVSTTEISGNPPVTLATRWESLSRNSVSTLQPTQHHNQQNQHSTILHHRNPTRAAHRKHHHPVTDVTSSNTMSSAAAASNAHMAQTSLPLPSPILTAQTSGALSDDDTSNTAIEYDDGENYFAYCFDRGNGRYTRLIPADVLPPLMDIPSVEHSCVGMRVLPVPRNLAPTGRSINMQPVDFATSYRDSVSLTTSLSRSPDLVQSRIDNIVATQPQPMPPTTPKRLKIYCDKWVHEGVCAFTQQGCKYKHEMPFDRETQKSLGLFHGLPSWWRKHHSELQRQIEASDASPTDQQALVVGSRSLNAGGEEAIYMGGGVDGYGAHIQTPLAGRRPHHSSDLSWRRQEAHPMASTVEMTSPPTPPSSGSRANKTFTMPEHTDSSTSHSQRRFSNSGRGGVLPGFGGHVTPYMTAGRGLPVGRGVDRSAGWGAVGTPVPTGFQLPAGAASRSGTQNRPERRGSNKFASMNMFDQLSLDNPQDSPDDGDDSGEGAQLA